MKSKFLDVFEDITRMGTKIPMDEYLECGKYPIIDQGQSHISGYCNSEQGLFTDIPAIIFGDHTRIIKYVDQPCFLGADGVKLLKTRDSSYDYKYLYYVLCNAKIPNTGYNRHFKWLKEVEIPLPSLDEQRKIASILDKVSDLISKRRRQLDKLDELVKARFVEMFGDVLENNKGWEVKKLRHMATFFNGKAHEQAVDENGKYILVTSRCIASDLINYRRTNEQIFPLYKDDICMVMSDVPNGKALAKCFIVDQNDKYTLNQRICCLRNYNLNSVYFYYLLNRHPYFLRFDDGDSQTNLRKDDLLDCPIIMPPIDMQKEFEKFFNQVDNSKSAIKKSLEKLELLKKALMQEYFG